jgi:hypothetical protein
MTAMAPTMTKSVSSIEKCRPDSYDRPNQYSECSVAQVDREAKRVS